MKFFGSKLIPYGLDLNSKNTIKFSLAINILQNKYITNYILNLYTIWKLIKAKKKKSLEVLLRGQFTLIAWQSPNTILPYAKFSLEAFRLLFMAQHWGSLKKAMRPWKFHPKS